MKFNVNQQDLQKSLNYCQGVIEKRSTLPILSNILLEVSNSKLTITATDLDSDCSDANNCSNNPHVDSAWYNYFSAAATWKRC